MKAEEIIEEARGWIGTPYKHQCSKKGVATDCIGLIRGVYEHFYAPVPKKLIPPYSPWWAEEGNRTIMIDLLEKYTKERDPKDRTPGTILTFSLEDGKPIKHAAFMSYDNRFIHTYDVHPVLEVKLVPWWDKRVRRVFTFPDMEG